MVEPLPAHYLVMLRFVFPSTPHFLSLWNSNNSNTSWASPILPVLFGGTHIRVASCTACINKSVRLSYTERPISWNHHLTTDGQWTQIQTPHFHAFSNNSEGFGPALLLWTYPRIQRKKISKNLDATLPHFIGMSMLLNSILNGFCPRVILSAYSFSYMYCTLWRPFVGDKAVCAISSTFWVVIVANDYGL